MSRLDDFDIAEFLKGEEKELRANDLEKVYKHLHPKRAVILTKFLLDHGIDPLQYVHFVPICYADGLKEYYNKEIQLLDNIWAVDMLAFYNTDAKRLYINQPKDFIYIRKMAFAYTPLVEVHINGASIIQDGAFTGCNKLKKIVLNESEEEWYKSNPDKSLIRGSKEDWPKVFEDAAPDARITFLK